MLTKYPLYPLTFKQVNATLFLSFEINNCILLAVLCRTRTTDEKIRETCKPRAQFKQRLFILCRHVKHRCELSRYLKRFMMESPFCLSGRMYNTVDSVKCMMWKSVSQPDIDALLGNNYWFQLTETPFAEHFLASHRMGPLQRFCWKFQREHLQLKARSIELYHCQPTSLLIGEYL
jgi:hypothetical protein